jgi:hypothetical protein
VHDPIIASTLGFFVRKHRNSISSLAEFFSQRGHYFFHAAHLREKSLGWNEGSHFFLMFVPAFMRSALLFQKLPQTYFPAMSVKPRWAKTLPTPHGNTGGLFQAHLPAQFY